MLKALSRQ